MHIKSIYLSNFKRWKNLDIKLNPVVNVLIGVNNAGKTSILEAVSLWKKCYDLNIQKNGRNFYSTSKNLSFMDLPYLRLENDSDLFFKKSNTLILRIELLDGNEHFKLGFIIKNNSHVKNTYFQVNYEDKVEFMRFQNHVLSLKKNLLNSITLSSSSPLAKIMSHEPYLFKPQVRKEIQNGNGHLVLRNKIIGSDDTKSKLTVTLNEIFERRISLKILEKRSDSIYINLTVVDDNGTSDISSQGSGFLQIAEIFSSLEYSNSSLHISLLDEPDSHIHYSLQKKMIEQFRNQASTQFLMVSHNLDFIGLIHDTEKILVNGHDTASLEPTDKINHLEIISSIKGDVDLNDELMCSKVIFFVEGPDDQEIILKILEIYKNVKKVQRLPIYVVPLYGIDQYMYKIPTLKKHIIKITGNPNLKSILLIDRDYKTQKTIDTIIEKNRDLDKIITQDGFCLESIFFSQKNKLVQILVDIYHLRNTEVLDVAMKIIKSYKEDISNASSDKFLSLSKGLVENQNRNNIQQSAENNIGKFVNENINKGLRYVLNKSLLETLLKDLSSELSKISRKDINLSFDLLFDKYFESIQHETDFYPLHLEICELLSQLCSE